MEIFPLSCPGGSACFVSHGVESEGECEGEDGDGEPRAQATRCTFFSSFLLFAVLCFALLWF